MKIDIDNISIEKTTEGAVLSFKAFTGKIILKEDAAVAAELEDLSETKSPPAKSQRKPGPPPVPALDKLLKKLSVQEEEEEETSSNEEEGSDSDATIQPCCGRCPTPYKNFEDCQFCGCFLFRQSNYLLRGLCYQ